MFKKDLETLQNSIAETKNNIRKIAIRLSKAPTGHLKCLNKGNYRDYYIDGKYESKKNISKISKLAERDYLKKLHPILQEKLEKQEQLLGLMKYDYDKADEIYEGLSPGRKCLISPFVQPKSEFLTEWAEKEYNRWEIYDEDVRGNFVTAKGERVRSKSEKIIADELTKYGIPYRYEYPLELFDGCTYVTKRPDFIAISPVSLKEYIIEHLGLADIEAYMLSNSDKIYLYEKNGYLIGRDLILFHETANHPLDVTLVDEYLEEFLI